MLNYLLIIHSKERRENNLCIFFLFYQYFGEQNSSYFFDIFYSLFYQTNNNFFNFDWIISQLLLTFFFYFLGLILENFSFFKSLESSNKIQKKRQSRLFHLVSPNLNYFCFCINILFYKGGWKDKKSVTKVNQFVSRSKEDSVRTIFFILGFFKEKKNLMEQDSDLKDILNESKFY